MKIKCYSLIMLLLCVPCAWLKAQTYANIQTNGVTGLCLLCGVVNPNNAVNTNRDDYSAFTITAGLLGVAVQQTLIFPAASSTGCDSLVIGIGSGNTLLSANLFRGVSIQTYNSGTPNNDAQVVDSSILRLLQGSSRATVILHPKQPFDRVKITLSSSLLGLLDGFRVYYAYYHTGTPALPAYSVPQGQVCGEQLLPVHNHQPGIDYRVHAKYTAANGGLLKDTTWTVKDNDTIAVPGVVAFMGATVNMAVQAVNPFTGCSSDTVRQVYHLGGSGGLPSVDADSVTICQGGYAFLHAFSPQSSDIVVRWYDAPVGGNWLGAGNYFLVIPDTTTTYYAAGAFTCEYPERKPVKVIVQTMPAPVFAVPQEMVCDTQVISIQNHQPGLNYKVRVFHSSFLGPVADTTFYILNDNRIVIPPRITYNPLEVELYVQAIGNGCTSDTAYQAFLQGGFAGPVTVDQDSIAICAGDSVSLHAADPRSAFSAIRWYDAPSEGNLLFTGNTYVAHPSATTTYYVTAGFECDYPQRKPVTVYVTPCATQQRMLTTPAAKAMTLKVFPNPTSGEVKIDSKTDFGGALLLVYDLQGREVKKDRLGGNMFRLDGANGLYLVRIVLQTGEVYQSFITLQK
ncbi:Por secretion system C-terminal sorting domain-containing protein [Chitinophaga eiseniae]|uniref:Por secretion system C-terminal sorting domain-containing protein n=1 Tax=Chitinophaga eiseniae TaxID=634771 RepID=A0A1T4U3D4_9BACT|nr:T9SS type A sorting domain-containing protein [Chitinophaga eiseniae]SKA47059.1 Por secretion system C-terminal sorting domain-containing protein [Chitinophaga eiseniae]